MIFCQKKESCRQGLPRPKNKILPTISPKKAPKSRFSLSRIFFPKIIACQGLKSRSGNMKTDTTGRQR